LKVFVLGLDGATLDLIAPWVKQGELPTFARLMREGACGELTTVIPPMTAPAWTTFMTGKNPGQHGIIDFVRRRPGSYDIRPVNASDRQARSIWDIAGAAGRRVGAINVPMTYPPEPMNGYMVTGLLTPSRESRYTYPPELAGELDRAVGGYRIHMKPSYSRGNVGEFLDDLPELTAKQVAAARYLMRKDRWDLLTLVLRGPDGAQHATWHATDPAHPLYTPEHAARYGTAILDVYRQVDAHLAELVSSLDEDTTLVVMSDHGFGGLHEFIYVNNWLLHWEFMRVRRALPSRLRHLAFRLGLSPVEVYDVMLRLGLGFVKGAVTKGKNRGLLSSLFLSFADVDWSRTEAYAVGNGGQIFVNLKGREPQGIVAPGAEYERVVERIVERLHDMRDPGSGARLDMDVYRRDELYAGQCLDMMPDVVFLPRDLKRMPFGEYEFGSHKLIGPAWSISGTHRMNGMLLLWGAGVQEGARPEGARMVDIAPTILALLGVPIPGDMDGRVLQEVLQEGAVSPLVAGPEGGAGGASPAARHPHAGAGYGLSDDEAAEISARLRGLGYVG
jgi:predicted AlkP superfamily phosphohydrolase/phosphomutase